MVSDSLDFVLNSCHFSLSYIIVCTSRSAVFGLPVLQCLWNKYPIWICLLHAPLLLSHSTVTHISYTVNEITPTYNIDKITP